MEIEIRSIPLPEIRAEEKDGARRLSGYAAVFNAESENLGGFIEVIEPGAFGPHLGEDIKALWNHERGMVLGRNRANTLRLAEDERGLRFELDLPDTTLGRDAFVSVSRGDVSGMSFGFYAERDAWGTKNGTPLRRLQEVRTFEISITAFPAYPQTDVAVRSLEAWKRSQSGPSFSTDLARRRLRLKELA